MNRKFIFGGGVFSRQQHNLQKGIMYNSTLSPQLVQEVLVLFATGGFTIPQRKALSFLRRFCSIVSVTCASLLIHMVLRKHRKNRSDAPTFHRFLLGLSIYDILYEIWLAIGVMAVPKNPLAGGYGAIGTRGTCTAQGFFNTLSLGSFIYNAGLSVYYVLVIRYGVREKTIAKCFEPFVHLLALTCTVSLGIWGLAADVYNPPVLYPPELGCFAYPYPPICVLTGPHTCERGHLFVKWLYTFLYTELFFVGVVVVMSALLYWTVRTQYRTSSQYASQETEQMKQRVRAVACQAFLFAFACVYIGFWSFFPLLGVAELHFPPSIMKVITFNFAAATSSQGLLNFVIYSRPRYNRLRQRRPEVGRWGALMIVIFGERTNVDNNRHRSSSTIFNKLFMRRRSTTQPSSQTVIRERRRSSWLSSSLFGATDIEGTTLDRGRWATLMSVMFGEDNGNRVARRSPLAVLFHRRSTIDTTRRQLDLSDEPMTETSSPQPQGTHQCSPISVVDASVGQNNDELMATTNVMCDAPTETGESLQHDAVSVLHDNDVEELVCADESKAHSRVDCESATLDLRHHQDKDIGDLDVGEYDHNDPPVVDGRCMPSPQKK